MIHLPHNPGKGFWRRCSLFVVIIISAFAISSGQEQPSVVGFITGIRANVVKGDVIYQRDEGKFPLEAGHRLDSGDSIKSGVDAYAELLLQPGNYLRIGSDSEFQIISDQTDRMKLKLSQGALNLETVSREGDSSSRLYENFDQIHELIRVITSGAEIFVTQPGVFRINANSNGETQLIVREGEALMNGRRVKEKRKAVTSGDSVTITDIDKKVEDKFDAWSHERAERMIQANRSLKHVSPWTPSPKQEQDQVPETRVQIPNQKAVVNSMVVSAKPGSVTFVEAGVELSHSGQIRQPLTETSTLQAGDKVHTTLYSFAELTLLPDMYLRLNGGSSIALEQLTNDSIALKVLQGSAILDISRFDAKRFPLITIAGSTTTAVIADEGNYRIDVTPSGDDITVRKGKLTVKEQSIGGCHRIASGTVSGCDKKSTDNFDFWSDHRGEGQVFNGRRTVTMANHLARVRLNRFRNTGFWLQNPGESFYTFVPFYSPRFRSPYGGNYSTVFMRLMMNRSSANKASAP